MISEGLRAYQKLENMRDVLGNPINRPKGSAAEQELRRRNKKSTQWFRKRQGQDEAEFTTTLFVPPTPGSSLARLLQTKERENTQGRRWGLKVVERRGTTVCSLLAKSYPWPTTLCDSRDCFPCTSADPSRPPRFSCRTPGIGYRISCLTCKGVGETSTYEGKLGAMGTPGGWNTRPA